MQEISAALHFNQWVARSGSHWSQWQNPPHKMEVHVGSVANRAKYERGKFIPSGCSEEDPFPKKSFSCIRVLFTAVPEMALPLPFYYPHVSTKHNIQLPLLHVCISSSWYFKLIVKESPRAKHDWWDNWLEKTVLKEQAKFNSDLSIAFSA